MFEKLFKLPWAEFNKGAIRLGMPLRPELLLLGVMVAVVAAIFFYRRVPQTTPRRMRALLSGLRAAALAILVMILFEPVLQAANPVTKDCFIAVLVDDSRSMRIEDAGPRGALAGKDQRKSRLQAVKETLGKFGDQEADDSALIAQLRQIAPVAVYKFGGDFNLVKNDWELRADGERTNIYNALKTVDADYRNQPLVGVVMLTDGVSNTGGAPQDMAQSLGVNRRPVYCVGFGDAKSPRDYEVRRVRAPDTVGSNTAIDVYATVRAVGFDKPFEVLFCEKVTPEDKVKDKGKPDKVTFKVLDAQTVTPVSGADAQQVRFTFKPEEKRPYACSVVIPSDPQEIITENNRRDFTITVADKRLPVLYLEGSPREEYRFLRRALYRDKDFRIASILRVEGAKKFILQGAEPEDGLEDGYPKTKEHLYRFEAVIFGDIEADYLSRQQLENTEAFVQERGGGFLMLGGVNSFNLGHYQGTRIAEMLPVVLPGAGVAYQQREFGLALTPAGEKHTVMYQSGNFYFNREIWEKAPTLIGLNPIVEAKPAAGVLAVEARTTNPLLVVQQYGAGRSAAFCSGGSWHWRMALPANNELHEKFWKQLVRWLALGTKPRLKIELDKDEFAYKEPVTIRATLLSSVMAPINDAGVEAEIRELSGLKRKVPLQWTVSQPGVYQVQYEPPDTGDYEILVTAKPKDGSKEVQAVASFSVGETLDEFRDAGQNQESLEKIAAVSGGKYYAGQDVSGLAEQLKERIRDMKLKETYYTRRDIWDTPLWFALVALALSLEWFLRRRSGLM